ncbi:MAG: hypothetical protein ACREIV_13900 [Planctomycetaceae bacterium]
MYITRFEESTFRPVAAFEEDIDLTTGSEAGVTLAADSVATWRENRLVLRTANSPAEGSSQYNNAVTIGWNNRIAGDDTTRMGRPASFTVALPAGLASGWGLNDRSTLQFLLMPTEVMPSARKLKSDSTAQDSTARDRERGRDRPAADEDAPLPPIDLSIEVTDGAGISARVPLSRYGAVRRPLESYILRRRDLEEARYAKLAELVLQTYSVPLADFRRETPTLDLSTVRSVRFLFDRAPAGTVVIDEIGFSAMDPAFFRVVDDDAGAPRRRQR